MKKKLKLLKKTWKQLKKLPIKKTPIQKQGWFKTWWPLLIAGLLYVVLASLEVMVGIGCHLASRSQVGAPEGWNEPRSYTYEVLEPCR